MSTPLLGIEIRYEQDVVLTRQRARQIAQLLNLSIHDQTAFSTSVSELTRNAFRYAGGGRVTFSLSEDDRPMLRVAVQDDGPGITDLGGILDGRYRSKTGMGLGIVGAKRLSDEFDIESTPGRGTRVSIGKLLPKRSPAITPAVLANLTSALAQRTPQNALEEVQQQNKELFQALDELRARQAEVERLNSELAETNRGVVALYAELDDKAEALRKVSEYKSRFLSDMTHELRTPLNAMVSLSRLLLDHIDGDLTAEQEKQVSLINKSATSLGDMVNDLLDLAKIEAGRTDLQVTRFPVADLLTALRGMFRPLVSSENVSLNFVAPIDLNEMISDERKLSQILRNLLSNALKFTERGEISLSARLDDAGWAVFEVSDSGIGIGPQYIERIFEDFTQIDSSVQRRVQGTGLGLPLSRKLARLLGGEITVRSTVDVGSTFTVRVPAVVQLETAADAPDPRPDTRQVQEFHGGNCAQA